MKVLVTDANYASTENVTSVFFVRGRNIFYQEAGIEVTVLNFAATEDAVLDNIPVLTLQSFEEQASDQKFDLLICHAPNIRNHYRFLKKHANKFPRIVIFFHGHEVLHCSKVYPKPFSYVKEASWFNKAFRELYDIIKLKLWKSYFTQLAHKSHFIFVSNWMYEQFLKWTKVDANILKNKMSITYNSVGAQFEKKQYEKRDEYTYDFITIRGNLDGAKYCVDKVVNLAERYPEYRFCVIGKGQFFNFHSKPSNVTWIDKHLNHNEIVDYLNLSACALMPTLTDAQGLMASEMATYGIPLITSDIPVCREVFDGFRNVAFISNDNYNYSLRTLFEDLVAGTPYNPNKKYYAENTCQKEIEVFKALIDEAK